MDGWSWVNDIACMSQGQNQLPTEFIAVMEHNRSVALLIKWKGGGVCHWGTFVLENVTLVEYVHVP